MVPLCQLVIVFTSLIFLPPSSGVLSALLTPTRPNSISYDSYIVTLKSGTSPTKFANRLRVKMALLGTKSEGAQSRITHELQILNGFSGVFTGDALDFIKNSTDVEAVYPDSIVRITQQQQSDADWGLQRISQREHLYRNDAQIFDYSYDYQEPAGEGTFIYILDTGIRDSHEEFAGRAQLVAQFGGYELSDGNGHGTHCAATAGGSRWGVSKYAQIRGIKVLDDGGSGVTSDLIAAIDYVVKEYKANGRPGSVISMSLGGGKSDALDQAVNQAVVEGVHVVVAAGNSNGDACQESPSAATRALTVGASDIDDGRAWYSNHGSCVNVFAPGTDITSAWSTSDTATNMISGTSMAAPHVAGLVSYFLSQEQISPSSMMRKIKSMATTDALSMGSEVSDSTPNLLVYNGGG